MNQTKQPAKIQPPQTSFLVERGLNKWGDIHFKKAMREAAQTIAGIEPETPLRLSFEKGKIVVSKVE